MDCQTFRGWIYHFQADEIPEMNTSQAAEAVWACIEGSLLVAKTRQDPETVGRIGRGLVEMLQARCDRTESTDQVR